MLSYSAISETPISYLKPALTNEAGLVSNDYSITYSIEAVQLVWVDYSLAYAVDASTSLVAADYVLTYAIEAMLLVSTQYAISYAVEKGQGTESPESQVNISMVSASRIVVLEGSGTRLEFGQMTAKPAYKVGDKWMSDRDPDEKSRYAVDITDDLTDRKTTVVPNGIELVLAGVEALEDPVLDYASVMGETRAFVIAFLGPVDGLVPDDWHWTARVNCANGERFDATTYFNKKET